ncbi:LPXTG cell wall anchor domain-containing protein, partial [Vibrio parahaemolyticus]|nr:LPXTG cell wall anchor domain-containing protein [Vibrio parahaemolyticus]
RLKGKGAYDIQDDEKFQTYVQHTNKALLYLDKATEAKKVQLSLSKGQVAELKKREQDPNVTIYHDKVGLALPLSNLSEQHADISMAKTNKVKNALTDTYDFQIKQDQKNVSTFKDPVTLFFTLDAPEKAKKPGVYYVDREKNHYAKTSNGSFENGIVSGKTEHFSEYTVLNQSEAAGTAPDQNGGDGGTSAPGGSDPNQDGSSMPGGTLPNTATMMYTAVLIGLLMLASGGILYYYQRKRTRNKVSS